VTVGRTLGRYELVSKIGGGAVERWLATQSGVGKLVEVRLVTGADAEDALERARIVAQIEHGNLVTVLDVGTADGTHFVVTEHVDGETLAGIIEAGRAGKRLDELGISRILADVAEALDAAHDHVDGAGTPYRLVHRRLSPSTVLVQYNGHVKVAALDALGAGPLGYAAPERLESADATGDRRGDIFALGAMLWEGLTLDRLFDAGDAAGDDVVKRLVRNQDIASPAELNANVPAPLADICLKALARDPDARQPTARRVALDLEELLTQASYSRRNDRIASYMADAFAEHIAAKRQRSGKVTSPPVAKPAAAPAPAPVAAPPAPVAAPPAPVAAPPAPVAAPPTRPSPIPTATAIPVATADASSARVAPAPAPVASTPAPAASTPAPTPSKPASISMTTTMLGMPVIRAPQVAAAPALFAATPEPAASGSAEMAPNLRATLPMGSALPDVAAALAAAAAPPATAPPAPEPLSGPPEMPAPLPAAVAAPVRPTPAPVRPTPAPVRPTPTPPAEPPEDLPDPAGVVALPAKDVVEGWGWSTGAVPVVRGEDDEYDDPPRSSRRPLLVAIGAAGAVIAIVAVVALAMGGSPEEDKKPARTAALPATQSETAAPPPPPPAPTPDPAATGSGDVAAPAVAVTDPGSNVAAGSDAIAAGSGSAAAGSAVAAIDVGSANGAGSAAATTTSVPSAAGSAGSATAPVVAAIVTPPPVAPPAPHVAPPAPHVAPPPPAPVVAPKPAPTPKPPPPPAPHVAKKPDAPKPVDPYAKPTAPTPKPADPYAAQPSPKPADPAASYKQGFQAYVHGDNTTALTALHASISANPGFAPAWRVLGLVLERTGERDQARAAFRRYLQLSPNASDADQIRDRLEKLGS
jgi:serine/threonine-protein kinase